MVIIDSSLSSFARPKSAILILASSLGLSYNKFSGCTAAASGECGGAKLAERTLRGAHLQITVDDAHIMAVLQCFRNLADDLSGLVFCVLLL